MSEVQTEGTFDLPVGYAGDRIILLARDPHWLYAYWEVSEEKKASFIRDFGQHLWDQSVPVIKVSNITNQTSFFIRVNDFSNNWYIHVEDPNSIYVAELGRRISEQFFIQLMGSNYMATPGDNISSNTGAYFINYKELRHGKLNLETREIYETHGIKTTSQSLFGLGSQEFFGMNQGEALFGVSSAELFPGNLREHLGVSSESFIR